MVVSVSSYRGTPSHHPFRWGFFMVFPNINHPASDLLGQLHGELESPRLIRTERLECWAPYVSAFLGHFLEKSHGKTTFELGFNRGLGWGFPSSHGGSLNRWMVDFMENRNLEMEDEQGYPVRTKRKPPLWGIAPAKSHRHHSSPLLLMVSYSRGWLDSWIHNQSCPAVRLGKFIFGQENSPESPKQIGEYGCIMLHLDVANGW